MSSRMNILIVEDNEMSQLLIEKQFENIGHKPKVVGSGREALAELCYNDYHLILMDLKMDGLDGFEATKLIRSNNYIHQPEIFALSASYTLEEKKRCTAYGMNGFINKPTSVEMFRNIVRKITLKNSLNSI